MFDLTHLFISSAWAQTAAPAVLAQPARAPGLTDIISPQVLMIILLFGVWFFLVIRPQSKQYEAQQKVVKALQRGDRVMTGGGIHGKITKVLENGEDVMLEIAEGVEIKILRSAIAGLEAKPQPVAPAAAAEEKAEK